jgi:hypothetical protein
MNQMRILPLLRREGGIEEENKARGGIREREAIGESKERRERGGQEATKALSDPKEP